LDSVNDDFADQLSQWAVKFHVTHSAVSALVKILRTKYSNLSKDARTLLSTPNTFEIDKHIQNLSGRSYYHFGIEQGVKQCLHQHVTVHNLQSVSIQVNVDVVPLFKSNKSQFWPILGMLCKPFRSQPFLIGLFYGVSKPTNLDFMNDFVEEYKHLHQIGLNYRHTVLPLSVHAFVCDAPARAMLKNVKCHSGYHSCERCTQRGEWLNKVVYPETHAPLRSDASLQMLDGDHHHGSAPLIQTGINLVSDVVLDCMHLVYLGVMRRLIFLWMKGPFKCRQSQISIQSISVNLLLYKAFIPSEFARKPRALCEIKQWKATEFRQFLLHTGPVALLGKLPRTVYKNFLLLSIAKRVLLNESLCKIYNDMQRPSLWHL